MAEKLSITIALEGGKQIEQQLEGIGKAGQKAFQDISKAAEQAGGFKNLKPEEVMQKLQQMGVTGKDALDKISGAVAQATRLERLVGVVQSVETGFANLGAAASTFGRALGPIGIAAVAAGSKIVSAMTDADVAIRKVEASAAKAGISIEKFDKLRQSMEKGGISGKGIDAGIQKVSDALEKGKLDQVAKDLEDAKKGFTGQKLVPMEGFGMVSEQMQRLIETARGVGPAVEPARKALEELGVRLAPNVNQSLSDMAGKLGTIQGTMAAFIAELEAIKDPAERNAAAVRKMGDAGLEISRGINTGAISSAKFAQQVATDASTISQAQADTAAKTEQSTNRMSAAWERFKTTGDTSQLGTVWNEFTTQAGEAATRVEGGFGIMNSKVVEFASSLGGDIWSSFKSNGNAAIDAIISALDKLWEKLKGVGGAIANAFAGGGGGGGGPGEAIPSKAAGGLIGGRGTGTSDSNLAWVSRGEYITPARAVAQPGVLALLEALRRTGGNLRGVMHGMGRFAAGGLVPRFAAGGLVGGGMGHLGTVDLRTDHGVVRLMAGASAVEQLSRLAVTKRMTSTGRKPGFIG